MIIRPKHIEAGYRDREKPYSSPLSTRRDISTG